jgi:hypothetical protein
MVVWMGNEPLTEWQQYKRDWKVATGALLLGLGLPLLLTIGAFHIQFLKKETASVLSLTNTCYVTVLKGSGKNRYPERDIAPCHELSLIYDKSPSSFINWGYASTARVSYVYRGEVFEAALDLFETETRLRASQEGIVWIVRATNRKGRLTVIDNEWHAVRFIGTGVSFLWDTQKGLIILMVFLWIFLPFARMIYLRLIPRAWLEKPTSKTKK